MRLSMIRLSSCSSVVLGALSIACQRATDPVPSNAPVAIAIDSGAVAPTVEAAGPSKPPPTGLYDLTVEVGSNSCRRLKWANAFSQPFLVIAKHEQGRSTFNLPIVLAPAASAVGRMDIEAGRRFRAPLPEPACPGFASTLDTEIVEASNDTIRIARTETYGDARQCATTPNETACMRETTLTFKLRKSLCDAPCSAKDIRPLPDGGADLTCVCP
jgi:hypothetical protein